MKAARRIGILALALCLVGGAVASGVGGDDRSGGNNLAVAWQGPGIPEQAIMAGEYLSAPVGPQEVMDPNLVGWWKFDETSGTTAYDSSGNGNDAAMAFGPQWVAGYQGGAMEFDGVDDSAWIPVTGLDDLQNLTMATWVNLNSMPNRIERFVTIAQGEIAVLRYGGANRQLHFYMTISGEMHHLIVDDVLLTGVWQHVAGTYDGSMMRLYLDGKEIGSLATNGTVDVGVLVILSAGVGVRCPRIMYQMS